MAGASAFEHRHKLHLGEIGLELVAIVLILQPGKAFGRWTAAQEQPCRAVIVLDLDDCLLQLARVCGLALACAPRRRGPRAADEFLVQTYARDTGAIVTVLTIPLFVKHQRREAVLLGWNTDGSR